MTDRRGRGTARCGARAGRGFTLIETLVAVSILAISSVVLLQLFSGALKSSRLSDEYTRGVFHAREKMDEILLARELSAGLISGDFGDGFRWKAESLPLKSDEAKDAGLPLRSFAITVVVAWDGSDQERNVTLRAMKLVRPPRGQL